MAVRVRAIDKAAELVRAAVEAGRREQIDPVIAPAEASWEIGDRHQLDTGNAERGKLGQLVRGRLPAALWRETTDMHLVDDQLLERPATPALVGPAERPGIDDLGGSVRPLRLEARSRVGQQFVRYVGAKTIAHTGAGVRDQA
jgi:hypothetical protein